MIIIRSLLFIVCVLLILIVACTNNKDKHETIIKDSTSNNQSCLCSKSITTERVYIKVDTSAVPGKDLKIAIKNGDCRFVGIAKFALDVPGVSNYEEVYSKTNGVKIIEATS